MNLRLDNVIQKSMEWTGDHCHCSWRFMIGLQLVIAIQTVPVAVRIAASPVDVDHQGKISPESETCEHITFNYNSQTGSVNKSCAAVCPPNRSTDKNVYYCWINCPAYLECQFRNDGNVASLRQLFADNQKNCSSDSLFFHTPTNRFRSCRQVCFKSTDSLEFCRHNCPGFYEYNEALLNQSSTQNSVNASTGHHRSFTNLLLQLAVTSHSPQIIPVATSSPHTDATARPTEQIVVIHDVTWQLVRLQTFVILLSVLLAVLLVVFVGLGFVVISRYRRRPTVDNTVLRVDRRDSKGNTNERQHQTQEQTSQPPGNPVSASLCTQPSHSITVSMSETNENLDADETDELLATDDPNCLNSSSCSLIPTPSVLGPLSLHSSSS